MAEGTPLLRVQTSKTGLGGSNPPFSAIFFSLFFLFPPEIQIRIKIDSEALLYPFSAFNSRKVNLASAAIRIGKYVNLHLRNQTFNAVLLCNPLYFKAI